MGINKIYHKFAMSQRKGIAEIIESKGIANIARAQADSQLPLSHEKILFSTITGNSGLIVPETKLLGSFWSIGEEPSQERKMKGRSKLQGNEDIN